MSEIWLFEISIFQIMSDYAMIYPYVKKWKYFFMIENMILHILVSIAAIYVEKWES